MRADYSYEEIVRGWTPLPLAAEAHHDHLRVALSRSHQTSETHEHVARLRARFPDLEIVEQGSSYKFCLLAEGRVDYYGMGYGGRGVDPRGGGRFDAGAARGAGAALQRGGPAQPVVPLPVEILSVLIRPGRGRPVSDVRRRWDLK